MSSTAIILMAFGGPASLADVGAFMARLMGRTPPPAVVERVVERYQTIGGSSPLPRIVREQASALEKILASYGAPLVRPAFRYAEPYISTAVDELATQGIRRIIGLSLSPHTSRVSTGAYFSALQQACEGKNLELVQASNFHGQPAFLDALAEKGRLAFAELEGGDSHEAVLLFSAHSLPLEFVEQGDPYVLQIEETIAGVIQRLPRRVWRLAYQSRGTGGGRWLEPDVETTLAELAAAGQRAIALLPVSFTCDHVETLYDIDVVIASKAKSLGLRFARAGALNTSELFIRALADTVLPHLLHSQRERL